ncbi:MAG: transcriptional repressor, partial [Pseudomonadota bacterium]
TDHHHYFIEGENAVIDIPADNISFSGLPIPPEGMEITRVDVIVRVRPVDKS